MKNPIWYRQCFLRRGTAQQVAWIPEELAVHGKFVRIKDEDGWKVICVWQRASNEWLTPDGRDLRRELPSIDR